MLFEEGLLKLVRPSSVNVALVALKGKMDVGVLRHISRPSSAVSKTYRFPRMLLAPLRD